MKFEYIYMFELFANQWFYKHDKKRLHTSESKIAFSFFGV